MHTCDYDSPDPHWVGEPNLGHGLFQSSTSAFQWQLNGPRDSIACLDHVPNLKRTHYGTYKSQNLHTARRTGPAPDPATEANTIDARAPSSTTTAARGVPHGIVRACARTAGTLRAASACDAAIARTGPATTAMPPRHVRNRARKRRAVRRARRRRRRARQRLAGEEGAWDASPSGSCGRHT